MEDDYMVYSWLAMSVTLNVMFFAVIYLNSRDRKKRIKEGLSDLERLLGELEKNLNKINLEFADGILEKLDEIEQELRK
jgi:predicted AlkP superfamily phosphohydrolase/phosphomutase